MSESVEAKRLPDWARQLLGPLAPEIERIGVRKVSAMAAVAIVVAASVFALTLYASKESMATLYRDLELEDAGVVVDKIKERGVPVELRDGGRTVLVPRSKVHELRIELASEGLPESHGVGFELFDRSMFASSDLVEQVNLLRALQGELARSIRRLDPVAHATVHIARPRPTVFTRRQGQTTASVVLGLKPGRKLSDRQIDGIVHLVSHAVDGLDPHNVTIVDENGVALAPSDAARGGSGGGGGLSLQEEVEQHLTHKAQSMLDAALGPGKAFVRVVAELDLERIEETRERFDPDGQVARRETITSRSTQRRGSQAAGGATGARARLQDATGRNGGDAAQLESEEKTETQYEIGRTVQRVIKSPGSIQRLSVSLAVDESLADKLDAIEKIVKTAVGYDARRGDSFDRAAVARASEDPWNDPELLRAAERRELIELVLRHGLPGFAGLLLTVSILGLARRASRRQREGRERAQAAAAHPFGGRLDVRTPEELDAGTQPHPALGIATVQPLGDELRRAVRDDPEGAANLLRTWLRSADRSRAMEERSA